MSAQLRLFEQAEEPYAAGELILGEGNERAQACVLSGAPWPGGALALIGAQGSGKTHLLRAWAAQAAAPVLDARAGPGEVRDLFAPAGARLAIEDADGLAEASLWLALDLARLDGRALLLTSRRCLSDWPALSPDLRSRLRALAFCEIEAPSLAQLAVLLRRLMRRRYLELPLDVAQYCTVRMPRRWEAAQMLAAALDQACLRGAEPISYEVARRALNMAFTGGLAQSQDAPWEEPLHD